MLNQVNHIGKATLHQAKLLLVKPAIFDAAGQIVHALTFHYGSRNSLPESSRTIHAKSPTLKRRTSCSTPYCVSSCSDRFRVRYANEFITSCRSTGDVIENGVVWHGFLHGFCFLGNHHNLFLTFSPYCAQSLNCWRMIGHYPPTASKVRL
uniref:Uncharacterized protein n=1 Tax=Anopheles merus TaxID=30066 RepID=A0A182VEE1_ANOME